MDASVENVIIAVKGGCIASKELSLQLDIGEANMKPCLWKCLSCGSSTIDMYTRNSTVPFVQTLTGLIRRTVVSGMHHDGRWHFIAPFQRRDKRLWNGIM
jgi:hypothetical protein